MSILIKGREMPDCCFRCPFKNHDGMWVRCIITGQNVEPETRRETKASSCPLIEVPQHSRLIDADALLKSIKEARKKDPEIEDVYIDDYFTVAEWVVSAPTIIPADKDGE